MQEKASRLLALRVATKLLALAALLAVAAIFIASLLPSPSESTTEITLAQLAPGELRRAQWDDHRIIILRRDPTMTAPSDTLDGALADPGALQSEQPPGLAPHIRSATADYFVALDYDPDFGCPLEYRPPDAPAPVAPWRGGFQSPCSGSWFDTAGRVYKNQRTVHNLRVPPHRVVAEAILLGE